MSLLDGLNSIGACIFVLLLNMYFLFVHKNKRGINHHTMSGTLIHKMNGMRKKKKEK
jgi:fucose permease